MKETFDLGDLSFLSDEAKDYLRLKKDWQQVINTAIRRHKSDCEYSKEYRKSEKYKRNREDENECLRNSPPEDAEFKDTIFYNQKFTIFGTKKGYSKKDIAYRIQGTMGGVYRTKFGPEISIVVLGDKPGEKAMQTVKESKRDITFIPINEIEKLITAAEERDMYK